MHESDIPRLSDLSADLEARVPDGAGPDHQRVLVLGAPALGADANLLTTPASRRAFLARASTLSLAIPGLGAALAACAPEREGQRTDSAQDSTGAGSDSANMRHHNSDSRLDTAVLDDARHRNTTATGGAAGADVPFRRYDPALPPPSAERTLRLDWHCQETRVRIDANAVVAGWTFEHDIPGPIVHCRVGDTVEFTLTNDVMVPHSMDFTRPRSIRRSLSDP